MRYYTQTFLNAFIKQVDRNRNSEQAKITLTMPSLSAEQMLSIAGAVMENCARRYPDLHLNIKMAEEMAAEWNEHQRAEARSYGWLAEGRSLTSYRNETFNQKRSAVLLCGIDKIQDQGSLGDFLCLNTDYLVEKIIGKSFKSWTKLILQQATLDYAEDDGSISHILMLVNDLPGSGLIALSNWLDSLSFKNCSTPTEVKECLLSGLAHFNMPRFMSHAMANKKAKKLDEYFATARDLFIFNNVSAARRKSYVGALANARQKMLTGELELERYHIGDFGSATELIEALQRYIEDRDHSVKSKLLSCDFPVVYEKLLNGKKSTSPKISISKLGGYPVNAVLSAVWKLFQTFCKERIWSERESLKSITIIGHSYKYGYEGDIDGSAAAVEDLAKEDLQRLVGGIDDVIAKRLRIPGLDDLEVSCSIFNNITYSAKKKAASELQFHIELIGSLGTTCKQDFIWKISASDDYRLAIELIAQCVRDMPESGAYLPCFHLRYYEELLASSSEEDSREILRHCLAEANGSFTINMCQGLSNSDASDPDPLLKHLNGLGSIYRKFMRDVAENGILSTFYAEDKYLWPDFQKKYAETLNKAAEMFEEESSNFCFMMMRAFLITQEIPNQKRAIWDERESSGIVTILHPTLLEMFDAQMIYLFVGFGAACSKALQLPPKNFPKPLWERYISLSSIHAPIQALKNDYGDNIAVDSRGSGLIHKIGQAEASTDKLLSTRVSLDPAEVADEVKSSELFASSNDSGMIFHVLKNYYQTHAHAWDGLHLAFFRSTDIQPVIAAIHQYLLWLADDEHCVKNERDKFLNRGSSYQLRIDFYTDKRDEADIAGYIAQWNEIWLEKISSDPSSPYSRTRKVIAHKILPVKHGHATNVKVLKDVDFNADIAFFNDVTLYGETSAHFANSSTSLTALHSLRFPILEKKECAINLNRTKRGRTISHKQFQLSSGFVDMVGTFCKRDLKKKIIRASIELTDWTKLIGFIHEKSDWVVCVDPNVDRRLLESSGYRDIISFGSGVGQYGESNYTVSTQQTDAKDLIRSLNSSLGSLFPTLEKDEQERHVIATNIYNASTNLTGLSLVRAASHRDMHVHDFIAHSLTYRFLKANTDTICDILVSLDDYPHWFQFGENKRRPDLLWLTADRKEGHSLHIHARLIECKLCAANHHILEEAQNQIKEGYEKLSQLFVPGHNDVLDDSQPDRRYWWMQLHRIISSSFEAKNGKEVSELTVYLENLSEGNFSIDFGGAIFAFWTDREDSPAPLCVTQWHIAANVKGVLYTFGSQSISTLMSDSSGNASRTWEQLLTDAEVASFELPEYEGGEEVAHEYTESELEEETEGDEDEEGWANYIPTLLTTSDFTNNSISLQDIEENEVTSDINVQLEEHDLVTASLGELTTSSEMSVEQEPQTELSVEAISIDADVPFANIPTQTKPFELSQIRVYLGDTSSGKKVYWEFGNPKLNNRHILLFGSSGCGKTYAMQCILSELAHAGAHNLIFDYTQSFTTREIKEGAERFFPEAAQHYVVEDPLPLNPFQPQSFPLGSRFRDEDPMDLASRVCAIFRKVYSLGVQQAGELEKAIYAGLEVKGKDFTFKELYETLLAKTEEKGSGPIETLLNRIQKILLKAPFTTGGELSWNGIFNSEIHNKIFQFQTIDDYTAKAVIEFLLWDLYAFVQRNGGSDKNPKVIVLDEIQNLDLDQNAPTAKYLVEGRKFGLALMGATQTLKGIGGASSYSTATLLQASQILVFQPSSTELADFAKFLHDKDGSTSVQEWKTRLSNLSKGECYFVGPELHEASGGLRQVVRKIKIASFQERDFS